MSIRDSADSMCGTLVMLPQLCGEIRIEETPLYGKLQIYKEGSDENFNEGGGELNKWTYNTIEQYGKMTKQH